MNAFTIHNINNSITDNNNLPIFQNKNITYIFTENKNETFNRINNIKNIKDKLPILVCKIIK